MRRRRRTSQAFHRTPCRPDRAHLHGSLTLGGRTGRWAAGRPRRSELLTGRAPAMPPAQEPRHLRQSLAPRSRSALSELRGRNLATVTKCKFRFGSYHSPDLWSNSTYGMYSIFAFHRTRGARECFRDQEARKRAQKSHSSLQVVSAVRSPQFRDTNGWICIPSLPSRPFMKLHIILVMYVWTM